VAALLVMLGVSGCVVVAPRHDYPSEYPVAQSLGACPDLNGTFENAGTQLNQAASAASGPIWLSNFLLAPKVIPSDAQVTSLQMRGPARGELQIEALTADGSVAHSNMSVAPKPDGFVHSKPFSGFLCEYYQGGNVILTNEPVTGSTKTPPYEVAVRIYRAKDGSLIVARERIYADYFGGADVGREWFRFQQVRATP